MGSGELEFWSSGGMETLVQRSGIPEAAKLTARKRERDLPAAPPGILPAACRPGDDPFRRSFGRMPKRARNDACAPLFTQNGTRILKSTPPLPNTPLLPKQLLGRRAGRLLGVHDPLVSGGTHFNGGIVTA
jgi:hypothetical protein